jgi:hypothetical protein
VQDLAVTFAIASGGGGITGGEQTTGADGVARVGGWRLGPAAGVNTMTATAAGTGIAGNPLTFTATGQVALDIAPFAGTYSGIWTNTTFGSTGTATMTITPLPDMRVQLAFASTGPVLGNPGGAPLQQQSFGYASDGAAATETIPIYGTVTLNVDATGNFTMSAVNVPGGGIDGWTATGTITAAQIQLSFTVTFSFGGSAEGTATLNRS